MHHRVFTVALQVLAVAFALAQTGCKVQTKIRDSFYDRTAPDAAQSLAWLDPSNGDALVGNGDFSRLTSMKATWTPSTTTDMTAQGVQLYIGAACNITSGAPIRYSGVTQSHHVFSGLPDGSYSFKVISYDRKNNASFSACSTAFVVDNSAPAIVINTAGAWVNNSNKTSYLVSGTCTDSGAGINGNVTVRLGQGASIYLEQTTPCLSGQFSVNLDTTVTAHGVFTDGAGHLSVTASVADQLGIANTSLGQSVSRDTTNPSLLGMVSDSFINIANKSAYTVTGSCDDVTSGLIGNNITITIADGTGTANGSITTTAICTGASGGTGAGATGTFTATIDTSALTDTAAGAATGNISISAQLSDVSGNSTTTATLTRKKDTVAPPAQLVFASNGQTTRDSNNGTVAMTATSCSDTSKVYITANASLVPDANTAGWANCVTSASNYSVTVASPVHGSSYVHKAWAIDEAGNISSAATSLTFTYDQQGPTLSSLVINAGNAFTGTPVVTATVTATDDRTVASVRVKEADLVTNECQSQYADDGWQAYSSNGVAQDYSYVVSSGDGTKYLCAWAKDAAGNVTSIPTPSAGSVAKSSIQFSVGNPPKITSLSVLNNTAGANFGTTKFMAGDQVKIAYNLTDVEGLDNNPISISYTTDNAVWKDVVSNLETTNGSNQTWFGAQTGNPTSYTGQYLSFNAPVSTFFRIKVVAKDLAGNTSVAVLSDSLNTPNWSIYAGTDDRGVGGTALTAALYDAENSNQKFAIHPKTNDIYAVDYGVGIKKIDAKTGLVSLIIKHGATDLPATGGAITSSSQINTVFQLNLQFDSHGLLYLLVGSNYSNGRLYQMDPVNMTTKLYIGGGTAWDATSTPSTAFVLTGMFGIDESNSIYYLTGCGGVFDGVIERPIRLMKVTQNADSSPGTFSVVAGDCTNANGSAAGPIDAINSPLATTKYNFGSIIVWNHGQNILFSTYYNGLNRKIINGQSYASNITSSLKSFAYNPANQKIYAANGSVLEYTLGAGANGDTYTEYVSTSGTGNCMADGVLATQSCVAAHKTLALSSNGTLFFEDGPSLNADRDYRIRYKDSAGKVRTLAGALPFFGDGLDKGVIRGKISGIHYKPSTAPNQAAFPEALYFTESKGMVIGKINPSSGLTTVLAGTQQGNVGAFYPTGTSFDQTKSLMNSYSGGNGMPLAFDSDGLPWFRYSSLLASVNANNQFVARQTVNVAGGVSGSKWWVEATAGTDPKNFTLHVFGGYYNLTFKNYGVFLFGVYSTPPSLDRSSRLYYFDFGNNLVSHLMNSGIDGVSADVTTPSSLLNVNLSSLCKNGYASCFSQYRSDEDRLYFSEETKLRYITAPNSGASTLISLFTQPASRYISNFIFSPAGDMIFYLSSTGVSASSNQTLHCHDISSGKSWCNDSALNTVTGLPVIYPGANQLTWKDSTHLLISTYRGNVLEYTLQP